MLAGCGASDATPDCEAGGSIHLRVAAGPDLNLAEDGRSLPTRLQLYQLRDLRRADEATFEDLWRQPEAALGSSLVAADRATLTPGSVLRESFLRANDVHHVLVMAVFRQPVGRYWRVILDLPPPSSHGSCRTDAASRFDPHIEIFAEFNRLHGMLSMAEQGFSDE